MRKSSRAASRSSTSARPTAAASATSSTPPSSSPSRAAGSTSRRRLLLLRPSCPSRRRGDRRGRRPDAHHALDRRSRFRAPLQRQGRNGRPRRGRRGRKPQGNHPSHPRSQHADRTGPHVHDLERRRRPSASRATASSRPGACANACLFTEDFELKGVFARRPRNDARR